MAKNKKMDDSASDDLNNGEENQESTEVKVKEVSMPPLKKYVPEDKLSFDSFFAYAIKKHENQVRPDHYRAMKIFLIEKNHAMIDSKEGFCEAFKIYGLTLD